MVLAKTGPKIGQIQDARQERSKTHDQSQFEKFTEELKRRDHRHLAVQLGSGYLRAQCTGALTRTSHLTEKILCDNPRPFHSIS